MSVLTIRVDNELANAAKDRARQEGLSLNQFVDDLLRAALDPGTAGTLIDSLRERLLRAGLTVPAAPGPGPLKLDRSVVAAAMEAAGTGTPLSDIIVAGRG